ncbi:capsule biosynthesis protein CapA, partial [Amylibacter sp.]|nr:capsule biosynthesis protein CapA [Amylibacter sp.]
MSEQSQDDKKFLFLQGPHGPFFYELSNAIQQSGASVVKIGFNEGDRFFWRNRATFLAYTNPHERWGEFVEDF